MEGYHYSYLMLALIIWILGYLHNGRFVKPKWKIPGKFIFYVAISLGLIYWISHYSLIFIIGHPLIGMVFHTIVCKRHKINWWTCQPRDRYLKLQEKWSRGDLK